MRIGGRCGSCAGAHVRTPGRLTTSGRIDLGSLIPRPYALRRSRSAVDPMADPHSVPSEGGETGVNVGKCGETPTAEAQDEGGNSIVSAVARHLDTVAVGRNGAFGNGALGVVGS